MDHLADRCRSNRPIRVDQPVRLPGDQAARGVAQARQHGIQIPDDTWRGLSTWAERLRVALPA
jgi:LDH2 family malate/lactate/ureidoglycolate dehydrogenase